MHSVSVMLQYMAQYLKTRLQYRANLVIEFVSDLMFQGLNLIFILVVFGHTSNLNGWTRDEIIFIYGYFLIPFTLFISFFNIWDFNDRYIVNGELDRVLTRPVHSLFQVILERMELESLLGAITGFIVMGFAAARLDINLSLTDSLLFIPFVLGGTLVYAGIFVMIASIGFWSDARSSIMPMIYNIGNYGRYPVDIYNKAIRFVLTWVLPFAFVGMYPSAFFLHKKEWYTYAYLTPVMGILFFGLAILVWNTGIKRYRGSGS
jgi:ABC-2 type transport system permease protein